MTISYYRPPTNPDGSRMSYKQRKAARQAADMERRAREKATDRAGEKPADDFYNLPFEDRRAIRQAQEQGRKEGRQRAAIEKQAKQQAEYDALPDHEKRPPNYWRRLIELRKPDAWRKDVARRIREYKRQAEIEDARIDAMMEGRKRQYELENQPEYAKALAHWERAHVAAKTEQEKEEWARLKGVIEGGGAMSYWDQVAPIMAARLAEAQERWNGQVAKQAAIVGETKALAAEVEAVNELQVKQEEAPGESGKPTQGKANPHI